MTNKSDNEDIFDLPPDLAELDRELSDLWIEERPSFGPELLAELEKAHAEPPRVIPLFRRPSMAAAAAVALLFSGLAVPQARASLAKLMPWVEEEAPVLAVEETEAPAVLSSAPSLDEPVELPALDFQPEVFDDVVLSPASEMPALNGGSTDAVNVQPEVLDREAARRAILAQYPQDLQVAGVGGQVDLTFLVKLDGTVDNVQVTTSSGHADLDLAAMRVAQSLQFRAGRRDGVPVDRWVDFPIVFEAADGPPAEPAPIMETPEPGDLVLALPADFTPGNYLTPPPTLFEAQELLARALGSEAEQGGRWAGQLGALIAGQPPVGELPNTWRREAAAALTEAMAEEVLNPAPALALARVRQAQGLHDEARRLLQAGLSRADAQDEISSALVAELRYELGLVIQSEWRQFDHLGRLSSTALADAACEGAPAPSSAGRFADAADVLSLNFLCPEQLGAVFAEQFEGLPSVRGSGREDMIREFELAVEAEPTHAGANTQLLIELADQRRWQVLLDRSQKFVWDSQGHPNGLLLSGLALERLGMPEQAFERFTMAMQSLEPEVVAELNDISMLLPRDRAELFRGLSEQDRERYAADFWSSIDPILTTPVNEREVEHLARAAYAYLRWGSTLDDASRVWIRYGRPSVVRSLGEGLDTRTEFWDYGGGPDLTFRRPATSSALSLTTESATYTEDLLGYLAHGYNLNNLPLREVLSLDGQVSRFQVTKGSVELEITSEVPPDLVTSADDELQLSIFMLDARGRRVSATHRRVPAVEQALRLRSMAPADARQVVVELFHRGLGRVASIREPVPLPEGAETGPGVSDLLFLDAADPGEDEVRRTAAWVRPNIGLVPADGMLGVLFELYEVPSDEDYGLRVWVDTPDGESLAVAFRPAGELETRTMWRRSADGAYRMTEYLTLDLTSLDSGTYTLRVQALMRGDGQQVETVREIRVR